MYGPAALARLLLLLLFAICAPWASRWLRMFLARPASGQFGECAPGPVVEQAPYRAEDRALQDQRGEHLLPVDFSVLGVGRLLVVEDAPEAFEGLLADQAREDSAEHAERQKEDLAHVHLASCSLRVSRGSMKGSSSGWCPASMKRPRSSSALNSAPSRIAMFEIHSHTRNT